MDFLAIDWHAVAVLGIAGVTFWLFASERLPVQTTALLAVLALMLVFGVFPYAADGRQLGPEVFLAGFGHTALITICCLMVLGRGLVTTGALEPFARALARLWSLAPQFAFLVMLVFCMSVSGVMNNTPLIVLLMPVLLSVAQLPATVPRWLVANSAPTARAMLYDSSTWVCCKAWFICRLVGIWPIM